MNIELLFAFRGMKVVSDVPAQQKLQRAYLHKSYRKFLLKCWNTNPVTDFLFFMEISRIFFFQIFKLTLSGKNKKICILIAQRNHREHMDYIQSLFGEPDFLTIDTYHGGYNKTALKYAAAFIPAIWGALRCFIKFRRRFDYVETANNLLFLYHYVFFRHVLGVLRPRSIIIANDHSPVPLAFAGAARRCNIKTAYIQHSHIPIEIPRLRFDLAILDGPCAEDIYKQLGPHEGATVFRGQEGQERPMNVTALEGGGKLTAGLFLNVFDEAKLKEILAALEAHEKIGRILIRPHPGIPATIPMDGLRKAEISPRGRSLWQDAGDCDLVFGGNSSFHLSVMKYGVPTAYLPGLDYIKYDEYEYIKNNVCYEVKSLQDLDFSAIAAFYKDSGWVERFRYYDPSYEKDRHVIDLDVKEALEKLIGADAP